MTATTPESSIAVDERGRNGDGANGAGPQAEDDGGAPGTGDDVRPERRSLAYNPALDGIRGLAVGAVLLFHGGFAWARGGFLGVSTFFTLSGFLITSLLVVEFGRSHRIGLTSFWARRLRRLLPASAVTLAALLVSVVAMNEVWEGSLPGDVVASALNVANWHFLFDERSYAELFQSPSPAVHFWSLAIEEQFYWVFPVLTAVVFAVGKGSLKVYGAVLAGLLGLSAVLTVIYHGNPNTVYYATPIRMGEILVGSLLAVGLAEGRMHGLRRWAAHVTLAGVAALAVSAWAWFNIEQDTASLYKGGLLVYALVSGALVLSACVDGPLQKVLGFEPLRLLGVVSYGVYLFHWPIFLLLNEQRVDSWFEPLDLQLRGVGLFALRLAVTLAVAIASYHLIEQPIRKGRRPRLVPAPQLAAAVVAVIVVVGLVLPKITDPPLSDLEKIARAQEEIQAEIDAVPASVPRVMVFGDSTAMLVSAGIGAWGLDTGELVVPDHGTALGCGIGRQGERRQYGEATAIPSECAWDVTWDAALDRNPETKVAVVLTGTWDIIDRRLPGDSQWRGLGDPVYDDYLSGEIGAAMDLFRQRGVQLVWLTTPPLDFGRGKVPKPELDPPDTPARVDRLNQLIREQAASRDGVAVVEYGAYIAALPPERDQEVRADGVHLDMEDAAAVADEFLGAAILDAAGLGDSASAGDGSSGPTDGSSGTVDVPTTGAPAGGPGTTAPVTGN